MKLGEIEFRFTFLMQQSTSEALVLEGSSYGAKEFFVGEMHFFAQKFLKQL